MRTEFSRPLLTAAHTRDMVNKFKYAQALNTMDEYRLNYKGY